MHVFSLAEEAEFDPKKHVEKILGTIEAGDVTVACWEPGQISPYHCHPHATEIYFCFEGGGTMRTPNETIAVTPAPLSCIRPARCMNTPTGRNARCYSASATATTWPRGICNGAAGKAGRKAPRTRNITGSIQSAPDRFASTPHAATPRPEGRQKKPCSRNRIVP